MLIFNKSNILKLFAGVCLRSALSKSLGFGIVGGSLLGM